MSSKSSKHRPKVPVLAQSGRQGLITIAAGPNQTATVTIHPWKLDAPDREYHADVCTANLVSGSPTLHFGQKSPFGALTSVLSIVMGRGDLQRMVDVFKPVLANLDQHLSVWSGVTPDPFVADDFRGDAERLAKFHAAIVRGGCDNEFAMLDFYSRELLVAHRLANGAEDFDIRSVVRIRMIPPLFVTLFAEIEKLGVTT